MLNITKIVQAFFKETAEIFKTPFGRKPRQLTSSSVPSVVSLFSVPRIYLSLG